MTGIIMKSRKGVILTVAETPAFPPLYTVESKLSPLPWYRGPDRSLADRKFDEAVKAVLASTVS
jgi:hypothetical protein